MKSFLMVSAAYLLGDSAAVADRDGQFLSNRTRSDPGPRPHTSEEWMVKSLRANLARTVAYQGSPPRY